MCAVAVIVALALGLYDAHMLDRPGMLHCLCEAGLSAQTDTVLLVRHRQGRKSHARAGTSVFTRLCFGYQSTL